MRYLRYLVWSLIILTGCQEVIHIPKWEVHEIVLKSEKNYENPYTEVEIKGIFTSPAGVSMEVNGFWDGQDVYKIRFTPTEEGTWTYSISSGTDDPGLLQKGKLVVAGTRNSNHGFVRKDRENPYHFVYDDGTRYYMCGTTYYHILLNALHGEKWKTAIDSALVYGINKFRAHICPMKNASTPYENVFPFQGNMDSLDHDRLNLDLWKGLDEVVQYAFEKGMVADLMPFGTGKIFYSHDIEKDKRFLRYVLARYAAYPNVIWCLVNEWNYRHRRIDKDKPYWNDMGQIMRLEDPWMDNHGYLRPLSIHQQTRIDFQFFEYDWPVHAIIQLGVRNGQGVVEDEWDISARVQPQYVHGDQWGNAGIVYNLGHSMPVVNDEYGYMGEPRDRAASTSPDRDEWPRFTRERHRNVIWGIAVAGGYGSAGDKNEYHDGKPYFSANWHSDPPEYRDIKNMVDFFTNNGIEYWKMVSSNDLISNGDRVYALGKPGEAYIIYAAAGGSFQADIDEEDFNVQLFDPRTAAFEPSQIHGQGEFELPDNQDWIIYLSKRKD